MKKGSLRVRSASSERKAEGEPGPHFVHRLIVGAGFAQSEVDAKVLAYLPDRPDQPRGRRESPKIAIAENLGHRPDGPVIGPFDDHPDEKVAMALAGQGAGDVEVHGSPRPALGHDCRDARSSPRLAIDARQQHPELGRDARTRLVLQAALAQDALEEGTGTNEA